jgi:hypothetical protein
MEWWCCVWYLYIHKQHRCWYRKREELWERKKSSEKIENLKLIFGVRFSFSFEEICWLLRIYLFDHSHHDAIIQVFGYVILSSSSIVWMMMMMYPTKLFEDRASLVLVFINKQSERKDIQKTKIKWRNTLSVQSCMDWWWWMLLSFVFWI